MSPLPKTKQKLNTQFQRLPPNWDRNKEIQSLFEMVAATTNPSSIWTVDDIIRLSQEIGEPQITERQAMLLLQHLQSKPMKNNAAFIQLDDFVKFMSPTSSSSSSPNIQRDKFKRSKQEEREKDQ